MGLVCNVLVYTRFNQSQVGLVGDVLVYTGFHWSQVGLVHKIPKVFYYRVPLVDFQQAKHYCTCHTLATWGVDEYIPYPSWLLTLNQGMMKYKNRKYVNNNNKDFTRYSPVVFFSFYCTFVNRKYIIELKLISIFNCGTKTIYKQMTCEVKRWLHL